MKKLRISKLKLYNKLNEDDTAQVQPTLGDDTSVNASTTENEEPAVKYIGSSSNMMNSRYTDAVCAEKVNDIAASGALFKVKLTHSFQKDIFFPKAPTQLASLMQATTMPKKFQNIYASYDDNPLKTISEAEDLALKYFQGFDKNGGKTEVEKDGIADKLDDTSYEEQPANNVPQQDQVPQPEQQLEVQQTEQAQTPSEPDSNNQLNQTPNESLWYYGNNELNELFGSAAKAAAVGASAGAKVGAGVTVAGSGLTGLLGGFFAGASPILATWFGIGYATGGRGVDHGNHPYDDSELHKTYSEETASAKSNQDVVYAAIDNYVTNLMVVVEQGLTHITSGSEKEIADLSNLVSDALANRNKETLKTFLDTNNKILEKARDKQKKDLDKEKAKNRIFSAIARKVSNHPDEFSAKDLALFLAGNKNDLAKMTPEGKKALLKIAKEIRDTDASGSELDDEDINAFESILYSKHNVLNEAEGANDNKIEFDADALYSELQRMFRQKLTTILASDPKKWEIVETARKQMNDLRDGASAEIKTSIEQVCRMANSDQMGLSGKLTSFISKHPMRAAKLTNLWKRHETDLNTRIEQRIKQISEMDGKGPLRMAREFFKNTLPNLLAMMITYKTVYTFFTEAKLKVPTLLMGNEQDINAINQTIENAKNHYPLVIATRLAEEDAGIITEENTPIFNMQSKSFNDVKISYLVPFLYSLTGFNNFNIDLMNRIIEVNDELNKYYEAKQKDEFFSRLTDFMVVDCNVTNELDISDRIGKALKSINPNDMKALIDTPNIGNIADMPISKTILGYLLATKGDMMNQYIAAGDALKTDGTTDSIKQAKTALHIIDVNVDDNIETVSKYFDSASLYFKNVDPGKGNENIPNMLRAYIEMHLYDCTSVDMNPYKILSTFVKMCNDPNLESLFGKDSIIADYQSLKTLWESKNSDTTSWDEYIAAIANTTKERGSYSISGLNLQDDDQFNKFIIYLTGKNGGIESMFTEEFDNLLKGTEYKDITVPAGMNSWNAIVKQIIINDEFENIVQLMNIDNFDKLQFGPNAMLVLKQLLLYTVQVAAAKFKKNRNDEEAFISLWDKGQLKAGDSTMSLSQIITLIRNNVAHVSGTSNESTVKRIVENADMALYRSLKNKVDQGFFSTLIYDAQNDFKNASEVIEYLKKTLTFEGKLLTSKEVGPTAFNDYLIGLCSFLNDSVKQKSRLFALASNKAPKDPKLLNANESYFFYGMTMYDMLLEADGSMIDFLNTKEGEAWLRGLAGDDMDEQLTGQDNGNSDVPSIIPVSDKVKEDTATIKQVSDNQQSTLG